MKYIYRTEALTKAPLRQLALIESDVPLYYVSLKLSVVDALIAQCDALLARYQKQLEKNVSRFQSMSAVRKQYSDQEKVLKSLQSVYDAYRAQETPDTAMALYEHVIRHIEFAAKHIPFIYDANAWLLAKHQVSCASIRAFFDDLYDVSVDVYAANITADELGIRDGYMTFYMMDTDVLYDFPTMLRTEDLPNFVLNITTYFKKDTMHGKTKSAVIDHAFSRIVQGLALAPLSSEVFLFRPNPAFRVQLSAEKFQLITERKRYTIQRLQSFETIVHTAMHYENGRYTHSMEAVESEATPLIEAFKQQPYIACVYNDVASGLQDGAHLPTTIEVIEDLHAFIEEKTTTLPPQQRAFNALLLRHFEKEGSTSCNN